MPPTAITVPTPLAPRVVAELLGLYAVKAESIHMAIDTQLRDRAETAAHLTDHQNEMDAVHMALDHIGWDLSPRDRDVELRAPERLILEVAYAVLYAAASDFVERCDDFTVKTPDLSPIDAALSETIAAHDLLATAVTR